MQSIPNLRTRPPARPGVLLLAGLLVACVQKPAATGWRIEAEDSAARVRFLAGGVIDIDAPRGLTLWHSAPLDGPVAISFEAIAVDEGGPNDQVSDLNAFWMATDPAVPDGSVFAKRRSGAFADYDDLRT